MGGPQPAQSPADGHPAGHGAPLIVLAEMGSGAERALVKRWLREPWFSPLAWRLCRIRRLR